MFKVQFHQTVVKDFKAKIGTEVFGYCRQKQWRAFSWSLQQFNGPFSRCSRWRDLTTVLQPQHCYNSLVHLFSQGVCSEHLVPYAIQHSKAILVFVSLYWEHFFKYKDSSGISVCLTFTYKLQLYIRDKKNDIGWKSETKLPLGEDLWAPTGRTPFSERNPASIGNVLGWVWSTIALHGSQIISSTRCSGIISK